MQNMNTPNLDVSSRTSSLRWLVVFILFLMILTPSIASAQVVKMKTYSYAYKDTDEFGRWSDWSDWEESDLLIVLENNDLVTVYTNQIQEFDIIDYIGEEEDVDGSTSAEFRCVDKDGLLCGFRIRKQADGVIQLYFEYKDFIYVYNVVIR